MSATATKPLIIAHRGSSEFEPEHTLLAYQRAIDEGADGWECDVRLTSDGHLVCLHDRTVNRTSNGSGPVSRHRLEQLEGLTFARGVQGGSATGDRNYSVLTLERLLEFLVDCGRSLRLFIETKHPTRHGARVEQRLVEALRRFGLQDASDRVTIMSIWPRALRRIQAAAPQLPTAQLLVTIPPPFRHGALPYGTPIAGPWIKVLRAFPEYVKRAREAGKGIYVWTVDEPADIDFVQALGVDAIITNRPAVVQEHLQEVTPP